MKRCSHSGIGLSVIEGLFDEIRIRQKERDREALVPSSAFARRVIEERSCGAVRLQRVFRVARLLVFRFADDASASLSSLARSFAIALIKLTGTFSVKGIRIVPLSFTS